MTKNMTDYKNDYNKVNYKNISLRLKPADYEILENYCNDMQISKQALIVNAIKYIVNNDISVSELMNKNR